MAIVECAIINLSDQIGDICRSQIVATGESILPNRRDGVANSQRCHLNTVGVSACCCISMGCRLKDRKVGEVGLWRGEGCRFNGFNVIYEGLDSL